MINLARNIYSSAFRMA